MKINFVKLLLAITLFYSGICYASGLLMPVNKSYPKDFLRNRSTQITVQINGLLAETIVNEEFENEWTDSTDAVYSFPLPADARATQFLYWYKNQVYMAVLKVKDQAVNPGTGEGGVAAQVNSYLGNNGIKIFLKGIPAGGIQKVELHYISRCDYYNGKSTYKFPLNTSQFTTNPLDHFQMNINVNSNSDITSFNIPDYSSYKTIQSDLKSLKLEIVQPKKYLNKDFEFSYDTEQNKLGVDFYSVANDSTDGHFVLIVRPQNEVIQDSLLSKRVFFLLSNTSSMMGQKMDQSIDAISRSIDLLNNTDYFNIVLFNYSTSSWKSSPVYATSENKSSAKDFLKKITFSSGNALSTGIKNVLAQITDNTFNNSIIVFTDGRSTIDPKEIESLNIYKAGIFPIGIGDNLDRSKLELTASLNFGFVTYISLTDNISDKIYRLLTQINKPILKDIGFEFGLASVSQIVPEKAVSTYAGSPFFMTGRYKNSGLSALSIAGTSVKGVTAYEFRLNFNNSKNENKFAESYWAKESIDAIERLIDVYGENDSLKQKVIKLSLAYGIRCRYTAYVADYITHPTSISNESIDSTIPVSYLVGNYPNPFNPTTTFRIYLDKSSLGQTKLLRIFNLLGELVAVIDITNYKPGFAEIYFNGHDFYGRLLPSGVYFAQLQVGNKLYNTIKINLIK